jgi:hypothetical protein
VCVCVRAAANIDLPLVHGIQCTPVAVRKIGSASSTSCTGCHEEL